MQTGDLIEADVNVTAVLSTLRRFDLDAEKILRKDINRLGTDAKRRLVAGSSVGQNGLMRASWNKKSSITKSKIYVAATIKNWPRSVARYPFILEHGRKAGVAKSGRHITPMRPRPLIAPTRVTVSAQAKVEMERIKREAINAFGH
jgi:hypothetical protein